MSVTSSFDLLLRGGRVIDPASGIDGMKDAAIRGGKIAAVRADILPTSAREVVDLTGKLVPGLIDTNAHVFQYVSGRFGMNPDTVGVESGVTTLIDQGGPSCMTLPGFGHRQRPAQPFHDAGRNSLSAATRERWRRDLRRTFHWLQPDRHAGAGWAQWPRARSRGAHCRRIRRESRSPLVGRYDTRCPGLGGPERALPRLSPVPRPCGSVAPATDGTWICEIVGRNDVRYFLGRLMQA
jgi:hypothetical protein